MSGRRSSGVRITRDTALLLFGMAGVAYETLVEHIDRPYLLGVFGACLGLPAFFRTDERRNGNGKEAPKERESRSHSGSRPSRSASSREHKS